MSNPDSDDLIVAHVIFALRAAADRQRKFAADGTAGAGEKYPGVVIRSPEAACATKLAADWEAIALELEAGAK